LGKFPSGFDDAFLSLAVVFGIVEYVRVKAGLGCLIQRPTLVSSADDMPRYVKWPLLMDVIALGTSKMSAGSDRDLDLPMIQCLLDKGADPNYMVGEPHGFQETSPLIESVSQLLLNVGCWMRYPSWVEATRLFARAGKIDNDAVDRAIRTFLAAEDLIWPKFRLGIFMQWNSVNSARKSLSKALQELARGENPDFSATVAKIENLAKSLQTSWT